MNALKQNPFSVQSPESISAEDVCELFVVTDFPKLEIPGHTFINGPRGSGKSMMFRYMQPDCQVLVTGTSVHELPYFGIFIPIKNMQPNLTELQRIEGHGANYVFNEHILCTYISVKLFSILKESGPLFSSKQPSADELSGFYKKFLKQLEVCHYLPGELNNKITTTSDLFSLAQETMEKALNELNQFIKGLSFNNSAIEKYTGPLLDYHDFLLPILDHLRKLSFMPNGPIFLLIDDADNLNIAQTKILNSWISSRTHDKVSIKVSTQLNYKTFLTFSGQSVDTPHDYSEVNIGSIYTSNRQKYLDRLTEIVNKRLRKAGIENNAEAFFLEDPDQTAAIGKIAKDLEAKWNAGDGRGFRVSDDVTRYARPDYMRSLGGTKKASSKYSYSGFKQLANISSGVIRCFLEPASQMFSEQRARNPESSILSIDPGIQNDKIREYSEKFMYSEMDKLKTDCVERNTDLSKYEMLENLIASLGGTFHALLHSDRAERRVFSIAFSDKPDEEVLAILRIGVAEGYFHESSIGNKKGIGRTRLYVLSRRLAPCFNLDPTSFSGYLFVTNARVKEAMYNAGKYLRDLSKIGFNKFFEVEQLSLFEEL